MKIEEIRRSRLAILCDTRGGVRAVAHAAGLNWQALDQVLKCTLLPAKADGTREPKSLGADAARKIEQAFDLGDGWFDWPFYAVDFKAWQALDEVQQAYVQGQLQMAIDNALKLKPGEVQHRATNAQKARFAELTGQPQDTPAPQPVKRVRRTA